MFTCAPHVNIFEVLNDGASSKRDYRVGLVKVKVAEALFNRVPVVATSIALRGLPVDSTAPVELCNTADEWVAALRIDSARSLAARRVPDEIASRLSPERHVAGFRAFASVSYSRDSR